MNVRVPDFSEMIVPTLKILFAHNKEMHINEIDTRLSKKMDMNQDQLNQKHKNTNKSEFSYRAAWARTYLKKYGLIENPERGMWKVNDAYQGEEIDLDIILNATVNNQKYIHRKQMDYVLDITSNNKKYIAALKDKYNRKNVSLFIGAGVSMAANMPSWETLVARFLISRFRENHDLIDDSKLNELVELEKINRENSLISQTRFIKQNMKPQKYLELLTTALYKDSKSIDLNNHLLKAIVKMIRNSNTNKIMTKNIVTFNFDNILERKFEEVDIGYKKYIGCDSDIDSDIERDLVYIYHVHGFLEPEYNPDEINIDGIIFSEEQYHKMYNDSFNWSNIVQVSTLRQNTCLFIGCSLSDPNMRRLLDIAKNGDGTKHYAILIKDKIECPDTLHKDSDSYTLYEQFYVQNRNSYFSSLGINVIWVDTFDDIPDILNDISGYKE